MTIRYKELLLWDAEIIVMSIKSTIYIIPPNNGEKGTEYLKLFAQYYELEIIFKMSAFVS